jgi:hypothetical protein
VWTEQVGVITGALTLRTELSDDLALSLHFRYQQADEWYVIKGGHTKLRDVADLDAVHAWCWGS